ncbi:hypothetical protein DOY81_006651, partial [Sarcophaga bullata]
TLSYTVEITLYYCVLKHLILLDKILLEHSCFCFPSFFLCEN